MKLDGRGTYLPLIEHFFLNEGNFKKIISMSKIDLFHKPNVTVCYWSAQKRNICFKFPTLFLSNHASKSYKKNKPQENLN